MHAHRIFTSLSLMGSALLIATGPLAAAPRPAPAPAVSIAFSPTVAETMGPSAARIAAAMQRELSGTLGASLRGRGEHLVVTVDSIMMSDLAGGGRHDGGGDLDGMTSTATVYGADGRVVESFPVVSSASAGSAGPWYVTDNIGARVDNIADVNASWIERYVGE